MPCKECACLKAANLAVSEKERIRYEDVKSITTNGNPAVFPKQDPANNLVRAVFDCNPQTVAKVTKDPGPVEITVCFNCAEYVREIETFKVDVGSPCGYSVQSGTYSVIEPDGTFTAIPGPVATAPVSRKILGFKVSFALTEITIYDFAVRTFGDKHVDIEIEPIPVDITSFERGGNDSVSSDNNAQDSLTGPGTAQETVSGIHSDVSQIDATDRDKLFAMLTASKVYAEDEDGNLRLLQLDAAGNLKVNAVVDVNVDLTSIERGGDDSVSSDNNAQDTLNAPGTVQRTVSGIESDVSTITPAQRATLFALLTAAKLLGEDDATGALRLLKIATATGRLKVDATGTVSIFGDVSVDTTSFERGGDDSVSADNNAQDTLTAPGTVQTTVSGIHSNVSTITVAQRATLFAKLVASKLFAEDVAGILHLLKVNAEGDLLVEDEGSSNNFFGDQATLASAVGAFGAANAFGFTSRAVALAVESTSPGFLEWSYDGVAVHGRIMPGETFTYVVKKQVSIFFKLSAAGVTFRAWAW